MRLVRNICLVMALLLGLSSIAFAAPKGDGPPASQATLDRVFQTVEVQKYISAWAYAPGWLSTGISVKQKTPVTISGNGLARWAWEWYAPIVGPDGLDPAQYGIAGSNFLVPGLPKMSLVAKIGDGEPVFVGSGPITLEGTGELYLGFNDDYCGDNSGGFTAKISYLTMPGNGYGDDQHQHSGPPAK